jgi:hypothetical protein
MEIANYFSSTIDWCEINNENSVIIVEFWNSISSLFISFLGAVGIYYYPNTIILYHTLIPIGITSFYFHATLSLLGQMLDEFFIAYSIVVSLHYINYNVYRICNPYYLILINGAQIIILFVNPTLNRFILFMYAGYCYKIINNIKNTECTDLSLKYINIAQKVFITSACCWVIDYLCVIPINLHALWHVLIGVSATFIFHALRVISSNNLSIIK